MENYIYQSPKQTPLRETYISVTEPIYPFYSNFVMMNFSDCLFLYTDISNYNVNYSSYIPTPWLMNTNYMLNTQCVRNWANLNLWDASSNLLRPYSRSKRTPQAPLSDYMYLRALLYGLGTTSIPDAVTGVTQYLPPTGVQLGQYNNYLPLAPILQNNTQSTPMTQVSGFNLTLYAIEAVVIPSNYSYPCLDSEVGAIITIYPLFMQSYVDGSNNLFNCGWDWSPIPDLENYKVTATDTSGSGTPPLPAIVLEIPSQQSCFNVWLPVQLYNLLPVDGSNNFSASVGNTNSPTMETVLCQLKGTFFSSENNIVPCTEASFIQFEIISPLQVFQVLATYELRYPYSSYLQPYDSNWHINGSNRPIFLLENNLIPTMNSGDVSPYHTSLLISPRCGVGYWSNIFS